MKPELVAVVCATSPGDHDDAGENARGGGGGKWARAGRRGRRILRGSGRIAAAAMPKRAPSSRRAPSLQGPNRGDEAEAPKKPAKVISATARV